MYIEFLDIVLRPSLYSIYILKEKAYVIGKVIYNMQLLHLLLSTTFVGRVSGSRELVISHTTFRKKIDIEKLKYNARKQKCQSNKIPLNIYGFRYI